MKKVRINIGHVGLVYKNGDYKRVIEAGSHWLGFGESVDVFDQTKRFHSDTDLNILLQDEEFANKLNIIEVKDSELVLRYDYGIIKEVLIPGKYVYWKGINNYTYKRIDLTKIEITDEVSREEIGKTVLTSYVRSATITSYEKGLLFIDGKYQRELTGGTYYFWRNAIPVTVEKVDTRQLRMEVSGQEILTKDKAAIRINFETIYKVVDIEKALIDNKDYEKQLYVIAQLSVREQVSTLTLDELLEQKDVISEAILQSVKSKVASLGVAIFSCGIKDIILPGDVKDIMNQVLIAQKKAQANVITRREETASARSQLNTAKLLEENPMLLKLKEMEYVEKIAEKINSISLSGGSQIAEQLKQIFT